MLENQAKAKEIEEANVIAEGANASGFDNPWTTNSWQTNLGLTNNNNTIPSPSSPVPPQTSTPPPTADDPPTTSFLQVPIGNGGIVVNPFYVPFNP